MDAEHQQLMQEIISKTQSELILFFVIVAVVLVMVYIPIYRMMHKERKERLSQENIRQDKYIEREREIIKVITANTEVNAGLKTTLEMMNNDTKTSFSRIHERLDGQSTTIASVQTTLGEVVRKQQTISDDVKRGFAEIRKSNERGTT
jgi:hypothetical protein